jgi:DNA-binding MarR family transcriptional regulator
MAKNYEILYEHMKEALQKSEKEKVKLKRRLRRYSKLIGTPKQENKFSDREKLILYGVTAYPDYSDTALSKEIGVKRSTITAIRNRLKSAGVYREIYIPNLEAIGCKAITFLYGTYDARTKELEEQFKKMSKISRFIGLQYTNNCFYALFATESLIQLQKEIDPILNECARKRLFKDHPRLVHFPFELNKVMRFFDYAPALDHLFELDRHPTYQSISLKPNIKLTKNMKDVMHAMVKYPSTANIELAKILRLSRTTVTNIRNKLIKKGFIRKAIVPQLKKMGFELVALSHFKFVPGATIETRQISALYTRGEPHAVLKISGDQETIAVRVFTDYTEESELLDRAAGLYHKHGFLLNDPTVMRIVPEMTKVFKFNFGPVTQALLNADK